MSLAQIAHKLHVAPSTISRAISRPELVAPKTREKILKYVAEIGYQPNLAARNLRTQRSSIIGIVVNDLSDSTIAQSAGIMQDIAFKHGYFPVLLATDDDLEKEKNSLDQLKTINICGLIIIPSIMSAQYLQDFPIPIVELDRSSGCNRYDEFRMDDQAAMHMACNYLILHKCKHIAVLFGNIDLIASFKSRYQALPLDRGQFYYSSFFTHTLKAKELTYSARFLTQILLQTTAQRQAAPIEEQKAQLNFFNNNLLASSTSLKQLDFLPQIDGIICTNHTIAAGVVQGFYDCHQELNQEIKVLTFDQPEWMRVLPHKLATITNPLEQAAQLAIERLLERLEHNYNNNHAEVRLLRPKLLIPDD